MSKREQWNVIIAEHIILMHLKLPFQNENTRIHPFGLIPKIEFFPFFENVNSDGNHNCAFSKIGNFK